MVQGPPQSDDGEGPGAPPPYTRTATVLRWVMVLGLAALAVAGVARAAAYRQKQTAATAAYVCPMHPEVVGAAAGTCPVCNMRLEPRAAAARPAAGGWERARQAGLRTVVVGQRQLTSPLEIPATVSPQEKSVVQVTGRYTGWIETLAVTEAGRRVERGQVLATIYSPELIRAQKTLLSARRWKENGEPYNEPSHEGDSTGDMFAEARFRVEALGVDPQDINVMVRKGMMRAVPVRAPAGGVVIKKDAVVGGYVLPGAPLFTIADLGVVSVMGDLPEADLRHVRAGQEAAVTLRAFPGETFTGKVITIAPVLDGAGGSARLRVDLPNPGLRLRPGATAIVRITLPARQALAVPPDSVLLRDGRASVFVAAGDTFVRRPVVVGVRTPDAVEIVAGLAAGDRIAAAGTVMLEAADSAGAAAGSRP